MNRYAGTPSIPHTLGALSPSSFQASAWSSRLFSDWLQDAGGLQKQLLAFCSQRMDKDAAALAQLAECTSPGAWLDLQAELLADMVADYAMFGQRALSLLGDAMQHQWTLVREVAQLPVQP